MSKHYLQLAKHFANVKDYRTAEQLFVDVQMYDEAIEMYVETGTREHINKNVARYYKEIQVFFTVQGDWAKAYSLCNKFDRTDFGVNLLTQKGKTFEQMGKLSEAEKLYLTIKQPDAAISMYKENKQYDQVIA